MKKSITLYFIFLAFANQSLANDSLSRFMREETDNKFGISNGKILYPNGTNSSTVKDFKYYTNVEEYDEGYKVRKAVIVHPTNEKDPKSSKISILQDVNYKDDNNHYTQKFSTLSVKENQIQSITNCDIQVNRNAVTNKNYRDSEFPPLGIVMIAGKVKENVTGQCFTITDKICSELKKEFKSPDFKAIKKELKACSEFTDKFTTALNGEYFKDIQESESNISALKDAWKTVAHKEESTPYIDSNWKSVYNNLEQGEREDIARNIKKMSEMINLCEKIDFYKPISSNSTTQSTSDSSGK